jgi:hypothetical protein
LNFIGTPARDCAGALIIRRPTRAGHHRRGRSAILRVATGAAMNLQPHLFATIHGCTGGEAAREQMRAATVPLDALYDGKVISGYQMFVIQTEDDYDEYDLDRPGIERVTGGALPAIFLNITYELDEGPPDLAAAAPVIAQFAFSPIAST